mmetsp:Transcript_45931/g.111885  ORF Transcript_45931/g.111885 Transcript_45931/m.111885 type:complete len:220 (+) Transcript_45931:136-795(+)
MGCWCAGVLVGVFCVDGGRAVQRPRAADGEGWLRRRAGAADQADWGRRDHHQHPQARARAVGQVRRGHLPRGDSAHREPREGSEPPPEDEADDQGADRQGTPPDPQLQASARGRHPVVGFPPGDEGRQEAHGPPRRTRTAPHVRLQGAGPCRLHLVSRISRRQNPQRSQGGAVLRVQGKDGRLQLAEPRQHSVVHSHAQPAARSGVGGDDRGADAAQDR